MGSNGFLINGFVDITGNSNKKLIQGLVDINMDSMPVIELGTYSGKGLDNQNISIDINNIPLPVVGIIQDDTGTGLAKVKVSFIQKQVVKDYCITNNDGEYTIFVEPGIYTIRIDGGQAPQIFDNQEIENGLTHQYYQLLKGGLIQEKISNDTIVYCGEIKRLIYGQLLNQNKRPIVNAEIIIIQNNIVKTYIKTDSNGKYYFLLENGIYDIKIRAEKQPIKYLKDINFENNKSFLQCLSEQSNLFNKDNNSDVVIKGGLD